jgi:hypothetical protein
MIPHGHSHKHNRDKASRAHPTELWRGLHKDWRTWAVIILMLAAIGTYVLTLDDSIHPGIAAPPAGPTAVAPAGQAK